MKPIKVLSLDTVTKPFTFRRKSLKSFVEERPIHQTFSMSSVTGDRHVSLHLQSEAKHRKEVKERNFSVYIIICVKLERKRATYK